MKDQLKKTLDEKRGEAQKTWKEFDDARNAAKAKGEDL